MISIFLKFILKVELKYFQNSGNHMFYSQSTCIYFHYVFVHIIIK